MYVDAHCHLDDAAFDGDRGAVIARARAAQVTGFVLAGVDPATWARQRALVATLPGACWTAGLHPCAAAVAPDADRVAALSALPGCFRGPNAARGLGETGLDTRFCGKETLDVQGSVFRESLSLARSLNVPVILHLNGPGTHARALTVFSSDGLPKAGGIVHAYGGSAELVAAYVALGLHVSFAGTVCRPEARKVHAAVRAVPPGRLLVETDAPDLAPPGHNRRNEPAALLDVAAAVAALRGETAHDVLVRSASACQNLFGCFLMRAETEKTENA